MESQEFGNAAVDAEHLALIFLHVYHIETKTNRTKK